MPHLFVDISSHGYGHLAQTAPILNCLGERLPGLRLTVRSALPRSRIEARLRLPFVHLGVASDFGFDMIDPLRVDLAASAERYRACHRDWPAAVAEEARQLRDLGADFVLSNASYRPLAGAALAGIPAAACCSLNWSDLFDHFFAHQAWAPAIGREIAAAYCSAPFLALQPAMPMAALPSLQRFPPVAESGLDRRAEIEARWPAARGRRLVLVGFGGIAMPADGLDVAAWARRSRAQDAGCCWLVPAGWAADDVDCRAIDQLGLDFSDLLASCDAVITKPGYGTFVEAACAGTPVLWLRRADWPEQECLIDWLDRHGVARELQADEIAAAEVRAALGELWRRVPPPRPQADGAAAVADWLMTCGWVGR